MLIVIGAVLGLIIGWVVYEADPGIAKGNGKATVLIGGFGGLIGSLTIFILELVTNIPILQTYTSPIGIVAAVLLAALFAIFYRILFSRSKFIKSRVNKKED